MQQCKVPTIPLMRHSTPDSDPGIPGTQVNRVDTPWSSQTTRLKAWRSESERPRLCLHG
ncbi:hypothetical protein SISNIDRAFT_457564 [Sistotremastrum niveocremeum HHB9708]|uniref:Uncharacterized protein n=1 Tax=Sistotremastrum niveocremeum HHB9708 TaxID=1314777 RepID=A0A164RAM0_9AGAM|nr:hypothetical protein SISNIDRAFT_457564 [Sistotremastrum niveocremeum HHB9708]